MWCAYRPFPRSWQAPFWSQNQIDDVWKEAGSEQVIAQFLARLEERPQEAASGPFAAQLDACDLQDGE